jgi:pyruvate,water dikinase
MFTLSVAGTLLWTDLALADDPDVVGGKAARLGQLIRSGLRVPAGGVVTIAAHRLRQLSQLDLAAFHQSLDQQVRAAGWPLDQAFAVRSSAGVEDSKRASFAGQFRSILNVPLTGLAAAIEQVQASVGSRAARAYARRLGISPPEHLAVIIQRQITPRLAGVCFTTDPVTGADAVIVDYAEGLGDVVADGSAHPAATQRYQRGRSNRLTPIGDNGPHEELRQVAELAIDIENLLQCPQDVEWAIDGDGLWILQARPITTIGRTVAETDHTHPAG